MENNKKPDHETLEEILTQIEIEKMSKKGKADWTKYIPIGWRRLTDEQRAILQEMINRYLEINRRQYRKEK